MKPFLASLLLCSSLSAQVVDPQFQRVGGHALTPVGVEQIELHTSGTGTPLHLILGVGALSVGENVAGVGLQVDEQGSTGGTISLLNMSATRTGSAVLYGLDVGHGIHPILHRKGSYVNANGDGGVASVAINHGTMAVDEIGDHVNDSGDGDIEVFAADDDTLTIFHTQNFDAVEILLESPASEPGCDLKWEYWTTEPSGSWVEFVPYDGTHDFRNSGVVSWNSSEFVDWGTPGVGQRAIRMTRQQATLTAAPSLDRVQVGNVGVGGANTHYWDKDGIVYISGLRLGNPTDTYLTRSGAGDVQIGSNVVYRAGGTDVAVADGGTGASDAAGARTALDVQQLNSNLTAISGGTWTGANSITTLGTIGTGTWQGTAIGTTYGGVPTGGTAGQVLVKQSGTNYDAAWGSPVTATADNSVLGSNYDIPSMTANSTFVDTGLTMTLPSAGTYLVWGHARVAFTDTGATGAVMAIRLYNTVAADEVSGSRALSHPSQVVSVLGGGTVTIAPLKVTVAGATTINLQTSRTGATFTLSRVVATNFTQIGYAKIAP